MSKKITTAVLFVIAVVITLSAQMHDAQWVISSNVSVLDFRNDTLVNYPINKWMNIFLTSATICDEQGELLYYTNGIFIADKNGDLLTNGDGLSPCPYTTTWQNNGLNIHYAALFLPKPGDAQYYYLFHFSNDALNNSRPGKLYYSVIDKQRNFGLGEVVSKNINFNSGFFREGGMTACKHANGRDYWLIIGGSNNNTFNKFLLTTDSLFGPYKQDIGPTYHLPYDLAKSCFSQDGSKYATVTNEGYVTVFTFDRCTGELSDPLPLYNNISSQPLTNPISGGTGIAFSPNGRFLYVTGRLDLNQYDLWDTNPQDSARIYTADSNDYAQVHFLELAPNGQIFASCWSGGAYYFHIIKKPNEKADSCQFVDTGFVSLTINSSNLPNMPNYKLGSLTGSICDTIQTGILKDGKSYKPRIQPNPADKFTYVEMPTQGNYVFELVNEGGQVVEHRETRQVNIINTENLPNGVYFLKVTGTYNGSQKIVVKH